MEASGSDGGAGELATSKAAPVPLVTAVPRSWANAVTAGNLLCGLWAVLLAAEGKVPVACALVLVAGILDLADGPLARWAGASGPMGVQLDALADLVSFGVAPAVVLHTTLLPNHAWWHWLLVATLPLSGMFRLARFVLGERDENYNRGLSIGMAGVTVALTQLGGYAGPASAFFSDRLFVVGLVISLSGLILVRVPYPTAHALVSALRGSRWRFVLIPALVPTLFLFPLASLLLLAALYVAWPPLLGAARLILGRTGGRVVLSAREEVERGLRDQEWRGRGQGRGRSSDERERRDTAVGS